jgi:hypothetical protein
LGERLVRNEEVSGSIPLSSTKSIKSFARKSGAPFPDNTIPANLIDPNAVLLMGTGVIPRPDAANNNFVVQTAFPTYVHEDVVRVDHILSSRVQLMSHSLRDTFPFHGATPATHQPSKLAPAPTPTFPRG